MVWAGAAWRPVGNVGRLPAAGAVRELIAFLVAACGLSPREAWETEIVELNSIAKAAIEREKRLLQAMQRR